MATTPRTQREMIYQLWFAVVGTDGDGLVQQVRDIKTWIATHPSRCPYEEARRTSLRTWCWRISIAAGSAAVMTFAGKVLGLW